MGLMDDIERERQRIESARAAQESAERSRVASAAPAVAKFKSFLREVRQALVDHGIEPSPAGARICGHVTPAGWKVDDAGYTWLTPEANLMRLTNSGFRPLDLTAVWNPTHAHHGGVQPGFWSCYWPGQDGGWFCDNYEDSVRSYVVSWLSRQSSRG